MGYVEPLIVLLEHGADIEACSNDMYTPLIIAAECGHADVVLILLSHGANVFAKKEGYTARGWAEYQQLDYTESTIEYNSSDCSWTNLQETGATIRAMLLHKEENRREQAPSWSQNSLRQMVSDTCMHLPMAGL